MRQPQWAPPTREINLYYIEDHILRKLGDKVLCDLEKFHCQVFLNELAQEGFSFTVVNHSRMLVKAILEEASDADLIERNPARKLVNPETKESQKYVLPKPKARLLIEALSGRDRLIAMIAAFCAMRPGEIFGLQWSSWRGDHFYIEGTAWRGMLRPGKAKTKGSKAPVTVPDILVPLLEAWRAENRGAKTGLIFPSEKGTPIRPENWLHRRIQPLAKSLGISTPVNFQVLRRTFATNAQTHGSAKDVQTHLRHSNVAMTLGIYTQPIEENVRKLVNAVADDVMKATELEAAQPVTKQVQ